MSKESVAGVRTEWGIRVEDPDGPAFFEIWGDDEAGARAMCAADPERSSLAIRTFTTSSWRPAK